MVNYLNTVVWCQDLGGKRHKNLWQETTVVKKYVIILSLFKPFRCLFQEQTSFIRNKGI
jgi:hypothetical protein